MIIGRSLRAIRRPGPRAGDALLAIFLAMGCTVAGAAYQAPGWRAFDTAAALFGLAVNLPLALRQRAPLTVLAVSCAAYAGYLAAGYSPSITVWGPLLAAYTVAATRGPREVAAGIAMTGAVVLYGGASLPVPTAVIQSVLIPAAVCVVGTAARRVSERNVQLAELTARLRAEQRHRARQAVVEERVHIARELHDVVAHHMSVVSVHAGLARYTLSSDPRAARAALDTTLRSSGEALTEMRRLLSVLRVDRPEPDGPEHDAAPGLGGLGELADRVRAAGVPVEVSFAGPRRPLPPGPDQCAFRVVQEALTNVLKHAAPAKADVTVTYGPESVVVRVADDGARAAGRDDGERTRHGLRGMRERAGSFGGRVSAGPRPGGGFEVVLSLPVPPGT